MDDNPGLARSVDCAAQCCGQILSGFHFLAPPEKAVICLRGKARSTCPSIGLHHPVPPKPSATIHGRPPNACVGPRVLHAPENNERPTSGAPAIKKKGPRRVPKASRMSLFAVAAVAFIDIGRKDDEPAVDREGFELD
jgi:hypothetical protein